ncbi:MAG: alpha/beta hydrolase [Mesorhizobium sp.]|uniref:alpha/beta fold hydrolase n=1 Tax=Mesorhizobium sp. TaxID=1871066 RepID=UPI000FE4A57C|nr:alpha/beta hydrolase [Mesorhizobium sp.]RWE27469.1 MAG: alpha/beta hydrolase [Mesorhizobium sp.]
MLQFDQSFRFEDQKIAWGRIGEGPPLVMIHGTPFSSQVWRRIAPLLASRRSDYFFDLLGYGRSAKENVPDVSLGIQNRLFAALLREWGLQDPDVLAHDFGGATALRAHYLQKIRYRSLILVDPVAVAPWGSPLVQHVREHEAAFAGVPDYIHEAILRAYLQGAAFRPLSDEAMNLYLEPWLGPVGKPAFYRQIAQMDQKYTDEIEELYSAMSCPVRLLWGEQDQWIPISQGERLANKLTNGALTPVPMAGHLVQEDAPEAIVAALR